MSRIYDTLRDVRTAAAHKIIASVEGGDTEDNDVDNKLDEPERLESSANEIIQ